MPRSCNVPQRNGLFVRVEVLIRAKVKTYYRRAYSWTGYPFWAHKKLICREIKRATVLRKINSKFNFRRLFHHVQIRVRFLKIVLKNVKFNGAFFKSGPGFWFWREVPEKVENYKFFGNSRSRNLQIRTVILSQILENLNFSILLGVIEVEVVVGRLKSF